MNKDTKLVWSELKFEVLEVCLFDLSFGKQRFIIRFELALRNGGQFAFEQPFPELAYPVCE